jgi:hypothetical protein
MAKYIDIAGQVYGKLIAINSIQISGKGKRNRTLWIFRCQCGQLIERQASRVVDGHIKSCGCSSTPGKYKGIESLEYTVYKQVYSDGDLSFKDFQKLIKLDCYYCGSPPSNIHRRKNKDKETKYSMVYSGLDRLDNNFPHNLNNVVPCCIDCNRFKSKRSSINFVNHVNKIYNHMNEIRNEDAKV